MGGKEVPIEAYYGIQTLRAVENFPITGYKIHESLIRAFAVVKSCSACEYRCREIGIEQGRRDAEAAQEILDGKWHDRFIVDPIKAEQVLQ